MVVIEVECRWEILTLCVGGLVMGTNNKVLNQLTNSQVLYCKQHTEMVYVKEGVVMVKVNDVRKHQ